MTDTNPSPETTHAPDDLAPTADNGPAAAAALPDQADPHGAAAVDSEHDAAGAEADTPAEPLPAPVSAEAFAELGLSPEILRAVAEMGYLTPTPIQRQAIPSVLMGRDVLGCAQTGTGKTAGFTLPLLDILSGSRARARMPRSLILEPTRELALQVAENFVSTAGT